MLKIRMTLGTIARSQRKKDGALLQLIEVLNRALLFDEHSNPISIEVRPKHIVIWRGLHIPEGEG